MLKMIEIIIPAYNAEKSITQLLDSLERQKIMEFSVCIVDDGSTDDTISFCEKISVKYSYRIKILRQENQGPGIARKTGFAQSKADYIMFCDADDYLTDDALRTILATLNESPVDVLEFGFQKVTSTGKCLTSKKLKSEYIHTSILEHYLQQKNTTNFLWNKVLRRTVIRESDFQKLFYSEDALALANIFARAESYRVIENKLYNYVVSESSACGQRYNRKRLDIQRADKEIQKIVRTFDESLMPYAAFNACVHVTKLYQGFSRAGLLDATMKKELVDTFKRNYKAVKVDRTKAYKGKSSRQKYAIALFRISPTIFELLK